MDNDATLPDPQPLSEAQLTQVRGGAAAVPEGEVPTRVVIPQEPFAAFFHS